MKKYKWILLIEDSETDIFIAQQIIESLDIADEMVITRTGLDAIKYLEGHHSVGNKFPDLILVDLQMPLMNGFEFIKQVQKHPGFSHEQTRIVVLTVGLGDEKERKKLWDLGIEDKDILLKPLDKNLLMEIFLSEP